MPTTASNTDMNSLKRSLLLVFGLATPPVFAQTFPSSNLPIVIINTKGAVIVDEPKVAVELGEGCKPSPRASTKPVGTNSIG